MAYLNRDYPMVPLQQAKGTPSCAHLALKPQEDFLGYFTGAYLCMKCRTLVTLPNNSPVDQSTKDSTIPADRRDDLVQCGTSLPAALATVCRAAGTAVRAWFGLK